MQFLDLTLPTPEENLALDEALLLSAESDGRAEYLRVWESPTYFVCLGKNCRVEDDVWVDNCRADGVPILRRISGGGTVLLGPGCLNFALVLLFERDRRLLSVQESFNYVLSAIISNIPQLVSARQAGACDLVLGDRKFSGNCQRRQRTHLLHHGTILLNFAVSAVSRYVRKPRRQPPHRQCREHRQFLTNIGVAHHDLVASLRNCWSATAEVNEWPKILVDEIVRSRRGQQLWVVGR